jgi:acyl-CoA thioesterase-1
MAARTQEQMGFELAERGALLVPCPLVARAEARLFEDGGCVAREVGVGPARVLLSWAVGDEARSAAAVPRAYRIETSADSRDGVDGAWREELQVSDNEADARAHVIEFDGQSWVRMTVGEAATGLLQRVTRFDVHDASDGTEDSWLVLGDALAATAFAIEGGAVRSGAAQSGAVDSEPVRGEPVRSGHGPGKAPSFAELVHESYPGYFPAVVGEGRRGESLAQTLARLPALLELHRHVRQVVLLYGERAGDADEASVRALLRALLDAGRVPVIGRLPVVRVSAALEAEHDLVPGPDLESWFEAHPDQLENGVPTALGVSHIHSLLAEALDVLYVPQ